MAVKGKAARARCGLGRTGDCLGVQCDTAKAYREGERARLGAVCGLTSEGRRRGRSERAELDARAGRGLVRAGARVNGGLVSLCACAPRLLCPLSVLRERVADELAMAAGGAGWVCEQRERLAGHWLAAESQPGSPASCVRGLDGRKGAKRNSDCRVAAKRVPRSLPPPLSLLNSCCNAQAWLQRLVAAHSPLAPVHLQVPPLPLPTHSLASWTLPPSPPSPSALALLRRSGGIHRRPLISDAAPMRPRQSASNGGHSSPPFLPASLLLLRALPTLRSLQQCLHEPCGQATTAPHLALPFLHCIVRPSNPHPHQRRSFFLFQPDPARSASPRQR